MVSLPDVGMPLANDTLLLNELDKFVMNQMFLPSIEDPCNLESLPIVLVGSLT